MTPEEKAKRLLKVMTWATPPNKNKEIEKKWAKTSALFACDEVINELECAYNGEPITTNEHKAYWKQVKKILEDL